MHRTIFLMKFEWDDEKSQIKELTWKLPIMTECIFKPLDKIKIGEYEEQVRDIIYVLFDFVYLVSLNIKMRSPNEDDLKRKEEEGWIEEGEQIVSWKVY